MGGIELPDLPKGREFEEYLAAYFQETGNYLEKHIIERHHGEEVLEIDFSITNYDRKPLEMKLVEAKSGKCKFSDIFKIRGWMYYLNFYKGIFISQEKSDKFDFQKKIAKTIDIDLVQIGDLSNTSEALKDINGREKFDNADINVWRYSYWIERALLNRLNIWKKSVQGKECFQRMYDYHFKTHHDVFFNKNIIERLTDLYDTFFETPYLTARVANELEGKPFDGAYYNVPRKKFEKYFYACQYTPLQISTYIEHKTRLSLFKNAVDYKLLKYADDDYLTKNEIIRRKKILGTEYKLLDNLPNSFKLNLDNLSSEPFFHRYPIFWQIFLWLFGGFILKDYEEQEYELLSQKSGIPIDLIPDALVSYDRLFPNSDGWFLDLQNSNIKIMKMFSIPFSGIGAHYRIIKYADDEKFEDLELTGLHTRNDLISWNNLAYEVLKNDLKLSKKRK